MQTRRWVNQSQPQTLVIATFLLYLDAVFLLLLGGLFSTYGIVLLAGSVAAGYGIANERKWAYYLALALAALRLYPYVIGLFEGANLLAEPIGLMFSVARVALLVHPQSREYQRIWFK